MSLITEPEIYTPNINENGIYIDYIPNKNKIEYGIRCPCGSRKDKVYDTQSKFSTHTKTKIHKKWLESINNNKSNLYVDNLKLKDIEVNNGNIKGSQIWMNKDQVEDADMIKIDVLSNRGLSQLWDISKKDLIKYNFDDKNTLELLSSGNNIGITHSES